MQLIQYNTALLAKEVDYDTPTIWHRPLDNKLAVYESKKPINWNTANITSWMSSPYQYEVQEWLRTKDIEVEVTRVLDSTRQCYIVSVYYSNTRDVDWSDDSYKDYHVALEIGLQIGLKKLKQLEHATT